MGEPGPGKVNALALKHPRQDKDFTDRCLWDLMLHAGQWRPLGRIYAAQTPSWERCTAVRDAVERGRSLGMVIAAQRGKGYALVGYHHPQRVWRVRPGKASSEPEARLRAVGRV